MPVSAKEVMTIIEESFDQETVDKIVSHIDGKMRDLHFLKNNRRGTPEVGYWWDITIPGSLSKGEIKKIRELYIDLGWQFLIRNSEDDGERAGMIGIQLQLQPEIPVHRSFGRDLETGETLAN